MYSDLFKNFYSPIIIGDHGVQTKTYTTMMTNSCNGLRTYDEMVNNAIPTGDGRYTTAKDVEAFFASLAEDFFPKGKAWPPRDPVLVAA